jgi:hypothetical protein
MWKFFEIRPEQTRISVSTTKTWNLELLYYIQGNGISH